MQAFENFTLALVDHTHSVCAFDNIVATKKFPYQKNIYSNVNFDVCVCTSSQCCTNWYRVSRFTMVQTAASSTHAPHINCIFSGLLAMNRFRSFNSIVYCYKAASRAESNRVGVHRTPTVRLYKSNKQNYLQQWGSYSSAPKPTSVKFLRTHTRLNLFSEIKLNLNHHVKNVKKVSVTALPAQCPKGLAL